MAANLKKTVKIDTDKKTGKTKVSRVHSYDASKTRRVAKSKKRSVVKPAKARAAR